MNQLFFPFVNVPVAHTPSFAPHPPSVPAHLSGARVLNRDFSGLLEQQQTDAHSHPFNPHTDETLLQPLLPSRPNSPPGLQRHSSAPQFPSLLINEQSPVEPLLSTEQPQVPIGTPSEGLVLSGSALPQEPSHNPQNVLEQVSVPTNPSLTSGPRESEDARSGSRPQPQVVIEGGRPQPLPQSADRPVTFPDSVQKTVSVPGERNVLVNGNPFLPPGRIADPEGTQSPSTVLTQPEKVPEARLNQEHQSPPSIKSQAHHTQPEIMTRSSDSRHSSLQKVQEDIPILRSHTVPSRVQGTAQSNVISSQEARSENPKTVVAPTDSLSKLQALSTPLGNAQAARALPGSSFTPTVHVNGMLSSGAEAGTLPSQVNAMDVNPSLNGDGSKGHGEQAFKSFGGDTGNGQELGGGFGQTPQGQGGTQSGPAALGAHHAGIRGLEGKQSELFTPTLQRLQMDVQLSEHQRVQVEVGVQQRQVYAGMLVDHAALKNLALQFVPQLDHQLSQVNLDLQEFSAEIRDQPGSDPGGKPSEHPELEFQGESAKTEMNESGESFSSPEEFEKEPGLHLVA